jgi:arginase
VFIGLRDVDPAEKELLRENGIKAFSMHEVDRYGIGKVVELALQHVNPNGDKPIHLSFDVDAMDPTVAPSMFCRLPPSYRLKLTSKALELPSEEV